MQSQQKPVTTEQSRQAVFQRSQPPMTRESLQTAIDRFKEENKGKSWEDLAQANEAQGRY